MALEDVGNHSVSARGYHLNDQAVNDGQDSTQPSPTLGETPSIIPDIPINAVFLALFLVFGVSHGFIFVRNLRNGRKFVPNVLVSGEPGRFLSCIQCTKMCPQSFVLVE